MPDIKPSEIKDIQWSKPLNQTVITLRDGTKHAVSQSPQRVMLWLKYN